MSVPLATPSPSTSKAEPYDSLLVSARALFEGGRDAVAMRRHDRRWSRR